MSTITHNPARPIVVVDSLDDLQGPVRGVVELPLHLDWTPNPRYDLSSDERTKLLYMTVLGAACSHDDLNTYLNKHILQKLWSQIHLPQQLRNDWENRHLELTYNCQQQTVQQ